MFLIFDDVKWMSFNILLAIIPVGLGWLLIKTPKIIAKIPLTFLWLIFLPNTIYLLTDIIHLLEDWIPPSSFFIKFLLLCMYCLLITMGIFTFVLGLHPLEVIFKNKKIATKYIIIVNFLIGIGIVLGRIERTNSWDVILNIPKFIIDSLKLLMSPGHIFLSLAFGIFCNILYFSCRNFILKEIHDVEKL